MENEYRKFLLAEIAKADEAWREALKKGDWDEAYIQGKRASDLDQIYSYHYGR